jgi:hypothetical protein
MAMLPLKTPIFLGKIVFNILFQPWFCSYILHVLSASSKISLTRWYLPLNLRIFVTCFATRRTLPAPPPHPSPMQSHTALTVTIAIAYIAFPLHIMQNISALQLFVDYPEVGDSYIPIYTISYIRIFKFFLVCGTSYSSSVLRNIYL